MHVSSADVPRVAPPKTRNSQCLQRVREVQIMRLSATPGLSGAPERKNPVSRQVQTQKYRNYNDLEWSGTMNDKS